MLSTPSAGDVLHKLWDWMNGGRDTARQTVIYVKHRKTDWKIYLPRQRLSEN